MYLSDFLPENKTTKGPGKRPERIANSAQMIKLVSISNVAVITVVLIILIFVMKLIFHN